MAAGKHRAPAVWPSLLRSRQVVLSAAGVLLLIAGGFLAIGLAGQEEAPQPTAAQAASTQDSGESSASPGATPQTDQPVVGPTLPVSSPVSLQIPKIGVNSDLLKLGLQSNGNVQVPPLAKNSQAGWYDQSPTPGQVGPSIILGHVDSAKYGEGVFFKLGALQKGNEVTIKRADDRSAVFRITEVVSYQKSQFPTQKVYGNLDHAGLRLITCGGKFDFSKHSYESNIVAYGTLVAR